MARYYVFNDRASAQACVDLIDARARVVYAAQGYTVDAEGNIVGKRMSDGQDQPDAARTETWDVPRQRADGKWVVRHTEAVPGATFVVDPRAIPPLTVADFVAKDIALIVKIEVSDATWWPAPPVMIAAV